MASGPDMLEAVLVPVHPAGYPFVAAFLGGSVVAGLIWDPLFWVGLLATAWCVYFFRDPARYTPQASDLVVSPADGVVQSITRRAPPPELELGDTEYCCIAVFMNVFDVHVNRSPVGGSVQRIAYHPGRFLNASLDKASDENERQSFLIQNTRGEKFVLVQIAGLVARRILSFVEAEDEVHAGERVGMIRFGSRCDVYLPEGYVPDVAPGQRALAGETVLARAGDREPPAVLRS